MYDDGIVPLKHEIYDLASNGDKESLNIILQTYSIVEVFKIKIASMENQ